MLPDIERNTIQRSVQVDQVRRNPDFDLRVGNAVDQLKQMFSGGDLNPSCSEHIIKRINRLKLPILREKIKSLQAVVSAYQPDTSDLSTEKQYISAQGDLIQARRQEIECLFKTGQIFAVIKLVIDDLNSYSELRIKQRDQGKQVRGDELLLLQTICIDVVQKLRPSLESRQAEYTIELVNTFLTYLFDLKKLHWEPEFQLEDVPADSFDKDVARTHNYLLLHPRDFLEGFLDSEHLKFYFQTGVNPRSRELATLIAEKSAYGLLAVQ